MNRWDPQFAEGFPQSQDFFTSHYAEPADSPDMNCSKPTGWCVHGLDQAECSNAMTAVRNVLESHGLRTHDVVGACFFSGSVGH